MINQKYKYILYGMLISILCGIMLLIVFYFHRRGRTEKADYNGDGMPDAEMQFINGRAVTSWEDRNLDGKPDIWLNYLDGYAVSGYSDDDFNGTKETYSVYVKGVIDESYVDLDDDHKRDYVEYYKYGVLDKVEWEYNSNKVFRVWHYLLGIKRSEDLDTDGDGVFDVEAKYDKYEKAIGKRTLKKSDKE